MKLKLRRFAKLSVMALVIAGATLGCRKSPVGVTPLPKGTAAPRVGDDDARRLADADKLKTDEIKVGGGETATWDPANFNADRAALAGHTVHFELDSSVVKSSERANVDAVAAALKADTAAKLLIEGHCDERGTEEYNRSLGERRALALRESLAIMGVDPMRIRSESFGEDKPVDPGHDESAWKKNRRGEFVLMHPK
jgi:peptidoglycan-associated lipoprotein